MSNFKIAIVVHGGAGSTPAYQDGCVQAAEAGFALLKKGANSLEAAVEAVRVMEDDRRFNAGTGSYLRLDGETIEMDASVMDTRGRLGAVMAIQRVKNPVLVALEVTKTPHLLLAGDGATAFARRRGFPDFYEVSERARSRHQRLLQRLKERQGISQRWLELNLEEVWNFEKDLKDVMSPVDTVGAVALDTEGHLAVASSTGGTIPELRGRVGDTPLIGCGFYAGEKGAVALTGVGEEIIRRLAAKQAYDLMASGARPQEACQRLVDSFPREIDVGVIALCREGYGVATNRQMASKVIADGW